MTKQELKNRYTANTALREALKTQGIKCPFSTHKGAEIRTFNGKVELKFETNNITDVQRLIGLAHELGLIE